MSVLDANVEQPLSHSILKAHSPLEKRSKCTLMRGNEMIKNHLPIHVTLCGRSA